MTNYAQATELRLKTKLGVSGKSIIEDMFFTPPLKIISPIYEGNIANIMLLSVSAGLMEGDYQKILLEIGERSAIKITSQSFEKVHEMQKGQATRETIIHVKQDAMLDFSPLPIIPFANSFFKNLTKIYLDKESRLYYEEIFCAGRVSRGEKFAFRCFDSKLFIFIDNILILHDNMLLEPQIMDLKNCCMFGDYTHYLNLIIYDKKKNFEILKQKILSLSTGNIGISQQHDLILIKALGHGSEELFSYKEKIIKFLSEI